jgi:hypothetical protein
VIFAVAVVGIAAFIVYRVREVRREGQHSPPPAVGRQDHAAGERRDHAATGRGDHAAGKHGARPPWELEDHATGEREDHATGGPGSQPRPRSPMS